MFVYNAAEDHEILREEGSDVLHLQVYLKAVTEKLCHVGDVIIHQASGPTLDFILQGRLRHTLDGSAKLVVRKMFQDSWFHGDLDADDHIFMCFARRQASLSDPFFILATIMRELHQVRLPQIRQPRKLDVLEDWLHVRHLDVTV
ncbi:hypothetical protein PF010_g4676 [Phytophthora fragariae]|uniref:Uncharacterized protein n=1 Tax=Phytophthora fragariae TaxID=53985 RepID=A0A6A4A2U9_9STRA|nr:hypothetical protein PF003_g32427 [Phytophthora fragariae]KAE9002066.1 hypothetical protein PF011_g13478 [Phytophthora fragariae]KAE9127972.1 hypothetical protein PF010_g4676 [Phytophthora fragariae]KAE9231251.1 hypothetical protein PF004_g10268 [Phytophthora fragariae]KAE9249231.1 hypothetical protein PF002_g5387 [Phytophthora fragariae]